MQTHPETTIALFAQVVLWWALVGAIYLAGRGPGWAARARAALAAQQRPALGIAAVCLAAGILGARLDPGRLIGAGIIAALVYAEALVGLALATGIAGFDPLPVAHALARHQRAGRAVALLVALAVAGGVLGLLLGAVGQGVILSVAHETRPAGEAVHLGAADKGAAFFALLQGAGLAEETPYRLVIVSLVWRLAGGTRAARRGRGLAIWAGALAFAAYHLTPLDSMYAVFWQYPIAQFTASLLIGLVWGWLYTRRGFETAVLAHTLSDWLPALLFA